MRKSGQPLVLDPPSLQGKKAVYILTEKVRDNEALIQYYNFEKRKPKREQVPGSNFWESRLQNLHPAISTIVILACLLFLVYAAFEIQGTHHDNPVYICYKAIFRSLWRKWKLNAG